MKAKKFFYYYLKLVVGCLIFSFASRFFQYDHNLLGGGTSSVAMIINQYVDVPIGMTTLTLNIPFFILGWRVLGLKFMINSSIAMVVANVLMDFYGLFSFSITEDILLASLYGGLIKGVGLGMVYSLGIATGGGDISVRLLRRKYPYVNIGTIMLTIDAIIVMTYAILFARYNEAMYTIISMYVASKVIDVILYGSLNAKLCYIISDKSDEINKAISDHLHRGVTLLDGHGGYSGKDKRVILLTVKQTQMVEVRTIARKIDPAAFLIVTDAREVFGKGFADIMNND